MITFFAADDQEPCKHCGRKHPEEVGCTRRKLLEDTLQKLGPLAAQVKKVREVQSKILDGKPPSTAQTKAMEEAAKSLEEILRTIKNPPKQQYKGKPSANQNKKDAHKGPKDEAEKERLAKIECHFWLKNGKCTGHAVDATWCPYNHDQLKAGTEPNKSSPFQMQRREKANVAILTNAPKIVMIADGVQEAETIRTNEEILLELFPDQTTGDEHAHVAQVVKQDRTPVEQVRMQNQAQKGKVSQIFRLPQMQGNSAASVL